MSHFAQAPSHFGKRENAHWIGPKIVSIPRRICWQ